MEPYGTIYHNRNERSAILNEDEEHSSKQVTIGGENVYQIKKDQLQQNLHKTIVGIKTEEKDSPRAAYGSGVLLSRNIILTAAHNIYMKKMTKGKVIGEQLNKERCIVYLEGDGSRYQEAEDWAYLKEFKTALKKDDVEFDYAIIKLKKRVNFNANTFLRVSLPCRCILNKQKFLEVNIYGYPIYEDNYQPLNMTGSAVNLNQFGLTKTSCIFQVEPNLQIKYLVSTVQGQSGCPIVINNNIIAIHKGGVQDRYNFGRLVTKDLIKNIQNWCKKLGGDPFEVEQSGSCPNCVSNSLKGAFISTYKQIKPSITQRQQPKEISSWSFSFKVCLAIFIAIIAFGVTKMHSKSQL